MPRLQAELTGRDQEMRLGEFAQRHALTAAEERLLGAIVTGRSLAEAAIELRRSTHTVRNQLKAILAKTGAKRQSTLVSMALGAYKPFDGRAS